MSSLAPNYQSRILPLLCLLAGCAIGLAAQSGPTWDQALDAVAAAPDSHRVLLDNDQVRVLEVTLQPGEREPAHTHRWPSVMVGLDAARIRYYDADEKLRFETPEGREDDGAALAANWLGPEPLHSVENIDETVFRALRVELKTGLTP